MVSDFLGGNTPKYNAFEGTPLGTKYTPEMFGPSQNYFGPSQDYSSIFNSAATRATNPTDFGGKLWGPNTGLGTSGGSIGGSRFPRSSISGGGGGGGSSRSPIEFSLGPAPELKGLTIPYEEMQKRMSEVNQPGRVSEQAAALNQPYQQAFQSYLPGFKAGTAGLSNLANTYISGQMPRDMAGNIARSSTQAGYASGLMGGGLQRNLTARDFGLGTMQLQQQGADLMQRSLQLAAGGMQATMPVSPLNLMVSPSEIFGTLTAQAQYNQQIQNENLMNAWQSKPLPGQFDVTKGAYVGYQPGSYSATIPSLPGAVKRTGLSGRIYG